MLCIPYSEYLCGHCRKMHYVRKFFLLFCVNMYISMILLIFWLYILNKMDHSYRFYPMDSTSMKDILAAKLRQFQT